jgi:hypothetical protein
MDEEIYTDRMKALEEAHESLCGRCGECCGAAGSDPCSRLLKNPDGTFTCSAYSDRLGPQQSRSGNIFTCVTIRDVHAHGVYYNGCAYNR